MPLHSDFVKIKNRFLSQFGKIKGERLFHAWLKKHGHDETKPLRGKKESKEFKEFRCNVIGLEIKESEDCYHVEGLIATTHIDEADRDDGVEFPDKILKVTLDSFAEQINTNPEARIMGVHHSEGVPDSEKYLEWIEMVGAEDLVSKEYGQEYFGEADVENYPAKVIQLTDGEYGLYVDTKLLKKDPLTPKIIESFDNGYFNSFSITYDTDGFMTTDFDWVGDDLVRVLLPDTRLAGYTAASNAVNPMAVASANGFKEFKELVGMEVIDQKEVKKMVLEKKEDKTPEEDKPTEDKSSEDKPTEDKPTEDKSSEDKPEEDKPEEVSEEEGAEQKEFKAWKASKQLEQKEKLMEKSAEKIAEKVIGKMEVKEKVLKDSSTPSKDGKEISLELKEFKEVVENPGQLELKEQFRRGAAACEAIGLDWQDSKTSAAESRDNKSFGVNGRHLEYKGLGLTTNQNTDTDYLQSTAELQDVYDPIIYNALNQATVTWNLLAKDDLSKKGNNQVQFTLKTAANASAAFYTGNAVATDNVTRLKYQTKFKKLQVGVSIDGDMIAAARGGPVSDVFAQEVMDSTMDMLAVLNVALFAEVGLETVAAVIGFEYITDSAGNTTLYSLTRSSANKLAPDSAGDTYIDGSSLVITMTNLRAAIEQCTTDGSNKSNLVYITNPTQANLLRGKFDDSRRMLTARDTDFGFSTDLFVDGVPVFEDKDCNTDDWFLVDLDSHRAAIWVPPTIERLGKSADNEEAFVKMYFAIYNRAPRRMVQIHSNATS